MDIQLTSDQKAFASRAIDDGRLHSEEEAVREALSLWEERERGRLVLSLDEAEASLARGEGCTFTRESLRGLAAEIAQRGLARLITEGKAQTC